MGPRQHRYHRACLRHMAAASPRAGSQPASSQVILQWPAVRLEQKRARKKMMYVRSKMVSSLYSTRRMARPIRDSLVGMYICYRVALTMGSRFCEGHQSLKKGFRKAPFQKVAREPSGWNKSSFLQGVSSSVYWPTCCCCCCSDDSQFRGRVHR